MDWYSKKSISMSKIQVWFTHCRILMACPWTFLQVWSFMDNFEWAFGYAKRFRHCASGFRHPRAHTEEVSQHFPDPGEGSRERGDAASLRFFRLGCLDGAQKLNVVWEWLGQWFSQTELSNFVLTGSNRCGSTKYFRGSVEMLHRSHWRTPGRLQKCRSHTQNILGNVRTWIIQLERFFSVQFFSHAICERWLGDFFFRVTIPQCAGEQIEGAVSCSRSLRVYSVSGTLVMDDGPRRVWHMDHEVPKMQTLATNLGKQTLA